MAYGNVHSPVGNVFWGFSSSGTYSAGDEDDFAVSVQRSAAQRYTFDGAAGGNYLMILMPASFDAVDTFRFGNSAVRFNSSNVTVDGIAYVAYVSTETQVGENIQVRAA